ncbi:hypothetical protein [Chryseobacterium daecheongense]|nr:hypothetical protein [Chryseobacterium daecheongense]
MKRIIPIMTVLMMSSCTNYIKVIDSKKISDEENSLSTRVIDLKDESLGLNFYGDYEFENINKKFIFFTNSDIAHLLGNLTKKPKEVLFTYTETSIYNNLAGFFYENVTLEDIKKQWSQQPDKDMGNGLLYRYTYKDYNIIDVYRQQKNGVIRFIAINNPKSQKKDQFELENEGIFFKINTQLWTQ